MKKAVWFFVGIFVLLLAITLFLERKEPETIAPTAMPEEEMLFLLKKKADAPLVFLEITRGDDIFRMRRGEGGLWEVDLPEDAKNVEQGILESAASQVLAIPLVAADLPLNWEDVEGQKQAETARVTVRYADETGSAFWVGDLTPSGNGYYVQYDDKIGIIETYNFDVLFQLFDINS